MSLATLKKKTQSKYNNSSVGVSHFSLNGGHRSQGYIGQTSLSRSLTRTLAKGPYVKGYGSQTANMETPSILSAVTSPENPSIIKPSVLSSTGMVATKYRWIKRPAPITTVKSDNNSNLNTQSNYLIYKKNQLKNQLKDECPENTTKQSLSNQVSFSTISYTRMNQPKICTYTKTIRFDVQTQEEYLKSLSSSCSAMDISGMHFTNNSCALVR